jgi:hypothetical protein
MWQFRNRRKKHRIVVETPLNEASRPYRRMIAVLFTAFMYDIQKGFQARSPKTVRFAQLSTKLTNGRSAVGAFTSRYQPCFVSIRQQQRTLQVLLVHGLDGNDLHQSHVQRAREDVTCFGSARESPAQLCTSRAGVKGREAKDERNSIPLSIHGPQLGTSSDIHELR